MGVYKGFSSIELRRPSRSTFDLSHEKRISSRIGKLTPVLIVETMPNDTFYGSTEVLVKLAPLIAPIYHRLNLYVHYFFVANRLLWKEWETFITGGRVGDAVTAPPVPPYFLYTAMAGGNLFDLGGLPDYLGHPQVPDTSLPLLPGRTVDAMPFAAYYRVFMDYYRDRNYTPDDPNMVLDSGDMSARYVQCAIRYRCWQHDYFTSALPFTQRGVEVLMPLQGSGTVVSAVPDTDIIDGGAVNVQPEIVGANVGTLEDSNGTTLGFNIENSEVSINDLRRALRLQEWLERNALAGSRYNESIMAHFGRKTSDGRLQRAEYLGGGKAVIEISEVNTTAFSEDAEANVVPPGNPAGRGSTYANTNRFSYNCEEHGFVIGILSVMPSSAYMQGIPRMFQRRNTFLDYPWPSFAHLGEQEVYDQEIYFDATSTPADRTQAPVFGYQSRYSDWKYIPSSSHGDFRTSLDIWHLTRKFDSQPVLGANFVTFEDSLQNRVFNVADVDTLWMYVYNNLKVKRSLPYFGTPRT